MQIAWAETLHSSSARQQRGVRKPFKTSDNDVDGRYTVGWLAGGNHQPTAAVFCLCVNWKQKRSITAFFPPFLPMGHESRQQWTPAGSDPKVKLTERPISSQVASANGRVLIGARLRGISLCRSSLLGYSRRMQLCPDCRGRRKRDESQSTVDGLTLRCSVDEVSEELQFSKPFIKRCVNWFESSTCLGRGLWRRGFHHYATLNRGWWWRDGWRVELKSTCFTWLPPCTFIWQNSSMIGNVSYNLRKSRW